MEHSGKQVVLITGAARGQGRSHALAFAAQGADVALMDVAQQNPDIPYELGTQPDLAQTAEDVRAAGGRAAELVCDVRDQAGIDSGVAKCLAEFGHIDTVVINHGVWSTGRFWEIGEEQWTQTFDVNVAGSWRVAKSVAPHLMERRGGNLILIGSISATVPTMNYAHYATSKAAIVQMTKIFAMELGRYNVRCNSVSPGLVDTPMINIQAVYDRVFEGASREDFDRGACRSTALAGRGQLAARSVTNAVVWLASEAASDVTGLDLVVDAGSRLLPRYNSDAWMPDDE